MRLQDITWHLGSAGIRWYNRFDTSALCSMIGDNTMNTMMCLAAIRPSFSWNTRRPRPVMPSARVRFCLPYLPKGSMYLNGLSLSIYIYIYEPQSTDFGTTLRPKYTPQEYMDLEAHSRSPEAPVPSPSPFQLFTRCRSTVPKVHQMLSRIDT